MIEITPPPPGVTQVRVKFTLTLKHEIKPGVTFAFSDVCVVGDFNGWAKGQTPLQYESSLEKEGQEFRKYAGEAVVETGLIYEYQFLVDGVHRWPDPDNPQKIPNAQGGENSILETPLAELPPLPPLRVPRKKQADGPAAEGAEAGLASPEGRLAEGAKVFREITDAGKPPAERIGPLSRAVQFDPYELEYRLALAAAELEAGRWKESADDCRRALALWPDEPRLMLLLGQSLLEAGQADEARTQFLRVPGEGDVGRQRAFDLLELSIRQARGPEDWKKVLEGLEKLEVDAATAGLFCEKCLKVLAEAGGGEIEEGLKALAAHKLSVCEGHPAYTLFLRVAAFDPAAFLKDARAGAAPAEVIPGGLGGRRSADLESFLKAHRLSNVPIDGEGGPAAKLGAIAAWRRLVTAHGKRWPDLQDAYISQLDRWGGDAYQGKNYRLAAALWGEAERMDPANPAVLQNLALAHTRMKDEKGYDWYWNRLARTLTFHGEMIPEAEGYARLLTEKHQAFVEGLQKAAQVAGDWHQMLELGAEMAREAVSLLAVRQIAFKNPLFRCGVCREDYASSEERDRLTLLASTSLGTWLKLAAEWSGLPPKGSALATWREDRLDEALEVLEEGGPTIRRSYESERAAFKLHRGQTLQQFLQLLGLLTRVSEHAAALTEADRAHCFEVARAVMSFPHDLLKPGLLEMNVGIKPDANVRELATSYAILPWFSPAQSDLEQKRFDRALEKLKTVQTLAPDFLAGQFYLAQCYAALNRFDEALEAATLALRKCPAEDQMRPHLVQSVPQILMAWAGPLMQKENWAEARKVLAKAGKAGVRDARLVFYEAVCLARAGQIEDAQATARIALVLAQKGGDKDLEKEIHDFVPQIPVLTIAGDLVKAQASMAKKKWREALPVLDQAVAKAPASAFAQFLKAVCHFNLSEIEEADDAARAGLKHADLPGLEEIKKQLQQIVTAASNHRQAAANKRKAELLNPMFAAMKKERWDQAKELSEQVYALSPFDENVRYYRALCLFRACMEDVKKKGGFRSKSDAESFIFPRFAEIKLLLYDNFGLGSDDIFRNMGNKFDPQKLLRPETRTFRFSDAETRRAAEQLDKAMDGTLDQIKNMPY